MLISREGFCARTVGVVIIDAMEKKHNVIARQHRFFRTVIGLIPSPLATSECTIYSPLAPTND
jgi:hypothetical protein